VSAPHIARVDAIDFRFRPMTWDFATDHGADIDANWQKRRAANPQLYNGKVLLMRDITLSEATLFGMCFAVDYKAFLAWHDMGHPTDAKNLFAMAALRSVDGAYMLGEMAPWTANAGQIYFPCGTPDLNDITGNTLDLEGSALRELAEETGLAPPDATLVFGWTIVFDGALIACVKEMRTQLSAAELTIRAKTFFATEKKPELTRLVPVFGPDAISDQMPAFMQAFLRRAFAVA
jgi:8-oxo-dGTP pyrophosphatase MutT (NUDIX family)